MAVLNKIALRGFRSIKDATLELRQLNVLIGSNGAGKSNLISFFKMLNEMRDCRLQHYIASSGHAQSLLHFGAKVTPQMEATLEFESFDIGTGTFTYSIKLSHAAGDTLVFAAETLLLHSGSPQQTMTTLGGGHSESRVQEEARKRPEPLIFHDVLNHCRVYHFHDTSSTARVKQHGYVGDNKWLLHDAGNLAAVLYRLRKEKGGTAYQRIVDTIRLIAPFFADFDLELAGQNGRDIILNWREEGSDLVLGPHQLSDGTLRAMCLVTLLLLPKDERDLIIVDEPELGLHPYALNVIASLFSMVSGHAQVLISTQSSSFVDNFEPEDIVVVDREDKGSTFVRPDAEALAKWLEDYSLGEVWEKNIIGGGPH